MKLRNRIGVSLQATQCLHCANITYIRIRK